SLSEDLPLIVLSWMRLTSSTVLFTIYPIIFSERACSIIYMKDYESKPRIYISTFIITIVSVAASIFSITTSFTVPTLHTITVFVGIPFFFSVILLFIWV
ncbi:unnamed protein product, partial [Mesorhabditis belari]